MEKDEGCINIGEEVHNTCDGVKLEEESETLDIFEQFTDEERVHDREEYIIKKEENYSNSLDIDANRSSATCTKEMPLMLEPPSNESKPVHLEQSEFPEDQKNFPPGKEICLDKHIQYNDTAKPKDEDKLQVELEIINIFEQFIDQEKFHDREMDANQSSDYFFKEVSRGFDPRSNKSFPLNIKNHKCHMCDFTTNYENDLQVHIKCVHLKIKKHKCDLCKYNTNRKSDLQYHVKSAHVIIRKCHLCDYTTSNKTNLEIHIKTIHLKTKEHKCQHCEYVTAKKSVLLKHVDYVHLKIKKHECHLCEYAAGEKGSLELHVKSVHLRIKEYNCQHCEYATSRKYHLKDHVDSVHLNIKKHQCHLCEYATNRKKNLEVHIKCVHLKIKEHECHLCEYITSKKVCLQNHVKSFHSNSK